MLNTDAYRSPLTLVALWTTGFMLVLSTVAHAEWSPDVKLSTHETSAWLNENMGHCLLADGDTLHVVWTDGNSKDHAIYYKQSKDKGKTWTDDKRISPTPSADGFPLLAQSGSTLHLVFRRNGDTPQSASYYKRSTDGGLTWGPDVLLGPTKWWPGVAAVGSNVYVSPNTVFADDDKNSVVYFRRSTDNGATWEPQQQMSLGKRRTLARSEDPALVADGKYVHLVWNDNRETVPEKGMAVCYRRSSDQGATWEPETLLTHAPEFTYFPTLCASGSNVDLAYGDRQSGHFQIFYMHSSDFGSTWGPKKQITHTTEMEAYPAITRSGDQVHLVWSEKDKIMYTHSSNGGASWDPISTVTDKGGMPFIAVSGDVVHIIFASKRDGHSAIYYKCNPVGNRIQ